MKVNARYVCFLVFIFSVVELTSANTNDEAITEINEARSWGHHFLKRIGVILIPTAFVVGAVTTLLAALTMVSVKGLGVGLILLILTIGQMIARGLPTLSPTAYAAPLPPPPPIPVVYKTW